MAGVEVAHARARKTHKLPADHARVSAVKGITEHAFDGVLAEERKEDRRFDFVQGFVLRSGSEEMKTLKGFQTFAVDLARRGAALITEFARSIFKRRLRIAKPIAAVRAGELAIDENGNAGFARAGAGFVGREDARRGGSNDEGFGLREKAKREANGLVLRSEERSFAVQRIHENAAQSCGGKREKMTAAHARECNRESENAIHAEQRFRNRPSSNHLKDWTV